MKRYSKRIKQKILLSISTILLLVQSFLPNISFAVDDVDDNWGGRLFSPIQSLVLAVGDVGEVILNATVFQSPQSAILNLERKEDPTNTALTVFGVMNLWNPFGQGIVSGQVSKSISHWYQTRNEDFADEIELPIMDITPDKIFRNEIPLLDVNIISPSSDNSSASILRPIISSWYVVLRNIATVGFLSMLVYVGIKITISSVAEQKSKYKQMLIDWVVGLCLLFVMHYIMSFSFMLVEKITDFISFDTSKYNIVEDVDLNAFEISDEDKELVEKYNNGSIGTLNWGTDLAGYIRFYAQTNIRSVKTSLRFGYVVMYLVIVIYTYMFLFQYLRRLLNIILLTILAPFVAFTYPLDKISDGKAQAFNMWLKEFTFNLLLQPMHLILYSVLVGSAIELATVHPIYALVVMGFLLQSEKFVRRMFRFDNASTIKGAGGGMLTGAMVMQGMNTIMKGVKYRGGNAGDKGSSGSNSSSADNSKINYANDRSPDKGSEEDDFINSALGVGNDKPNKDNISKTANDEENTFDGFDTTPNINDLDAGEKSNEYDSFDGFDTTPNINDFDTGEGSNKYDSFDGFDTTPNINDLDMGENNNKPNKKIKIKNSAGTLRNKVGTAAGYIGAATRLYAPKALRTAAKLGGAAIIGGAAGTIGIASGLASDDYSNVFKFGAGATAGGIAAGSTIGNNLANATSSIPKLPKTFADAHERIEQERLKNNPDEYKRHMNERADKQWRADKNAQLKYIEAFGKQQYSEKMEKAMEYRRHGVTDDKLIIKAMKNNSEFLGEDISSDRRIVSAKLASNVNNEKDIESIEKRLKSRGVSDENVEKQINVIRNMKNLI